MRPARAARIGAAPRPPAPRPTRPATPAAAAASTPSTPAPPPPPPPPLLTWADVQADAAAAGLALTLSVVGPFFRLDCRLAGGQAPPPPPTPPIATLAGALAPPWLAPWAGGIAHIDTLEVRNRGLAPEDARAVRAALGPAGVGGLLARAAFAHAHEVGRCRTAEALAILDDEATHARLVGVYKRVAGFREVRKKGKEGKKGNDREVPFGWRLLFSPHSLSPPHRFQVAFVSGSRLADLPHMLVWGGAGTRLDADIPAALARWGAGRARRKAAGGKEG